MYTCGKTVRKKSPNTPSPVNRNDGARRRGHARCRRSLPLRGRGARGHPRAPGDRTKEISKKTLERIISYSPRSANHFKSTTKDNEDTKPSINNNSSTSNKLVLWPHQQEAIDKFLKVKAGILEMATGTGKTKTSLEILRILSSKNEINSCIISTSGNTLLEQWYLELINFINSNRISS